MIPRVCPASYKRGPKWEWGQKQRTGLDVLLATPPSSELERPQNRETLKASTPTSFYRRESWEKTHAQKEDRGSVPKLDGEQDEMCVHMSSVSGSRDCMELSRADKAIQ